MLQELSTQTTRLHLVISFFPWMNLSSIIILSDYFEPPYFSPWCFYAQTHPDTDLTVLNYGLIESRIDYSKISEDYKYIPCSRRLLTCGCWSDDYYKGLEMLKMLVLINWRAWMNIFILNLGIISCPWNWSLKQPECCTFSYLFFCLFQGCGHFSDSESITINL